MASDLILSVADLRLDKQDKALLDGVSFSLSPGRFYGLLGPNGAGKSSLLRILYRAERASGGRVLLEGQDINTIARRDYATRVGALVQEQVNLAGLSLKEVVRLGLLPLKLTRSETEKRVTAARGEIGLLHRVPRTATVTACEPCVTWEIPADLFLSAASQAGLSSALTENVRVRVVSSPALSRSTEL